MAELRAYDERVLADAVREHHTGGLRQRDRDRTVVALKLDAAGVCHEDIALVCGIQPRQVPAVLRGERI